MNMMKNLFNIPFHTLGLVANAHLDPAGIVVIQRTVKFLQSPQSRSSKKSPPYKLLFNKHALTALGPQKRERVSINKGFDIIETPCPMRP